MFQIIQFTDDVLKDDENRLHRAVKREIQESMLTTDNGTEGFEEFLDNGEDELPCHMSIVDEEELFQRVTGYNEDLESF